MTWEKPAFVILHMIFLQTFKSQIYIIAGTAGAFHELCPELLHPNKLPAHTQIMQALNSSVVHK